MRISASIPIRKIAAGSDTYKRGFHRGDPGGLDAIETDLATANIKNGIVIFGKSGSADVRDIGDADAEVGDVKDPKTFYAVSGGKKTGTMPTVAIVADNDNYPAGYHAGNVGGLDAIETDLATANIKNGIVIFGKSGSADVRDIGDADAEVGDVKDPKTFYAVSGGKKTGTMPTVAIVAGNDNYPAGYHAGNVGGLDAIDTELAPGNIKKDVVIFGKTGTFENTLAEDTTGSEKSAWVTNTIGSYFYQTTIATTADKDLPAKTLAFAAVSMAVAVAVCVAAFSEINHIKLRVLMGGVEAAESAYLPPAGQCNVVIGTRALSGSQECKGQLHNYGGNLTTCRFGGYSNDNLAGAGIAIGSIKI